MLVVELFRAHGMSISPFFTYPGCRASGHQQFKTSPRALWSRCCLHAKSLPPFDKRLCLFVWKIIFLLYQYTPLSYHFRSPVYTVRGKPMCIVNFAARWLSTSPDFIKDLCICFRFATDMINIVTVLTFVIGDVLSKFLWDLNFSMDFMYVS